MKRNSIWVAAGLGLAQLLNATASAQEQEKTVRSLDEVVVTASRSPKKQSEIGKVVRVIGSEELNRSQGRTLPEVLNNVAGLTLSGSGGGFGTIVTAYTRGASAGYTLILIDGIPVNNASLISGEYDLTSFSVDQIERVEILRGVNSTLYGSDAVAGVINIITKQPSKNKVNGDVVLSGGSYSTFKEAVGVNGTINKTGIAANFSNTSSKGFSVAANNPSSSTKYEKDGLVQTAFNSRITQQFSDKFSLSANLQVSRNTFDMDAGAFTDDPDYKGKNSFLFGGFTGKYILPKGVLNVNVSQNNVWYKFTNPNASNVYTVGKITYSEAILNQQLGNNFDLTAGLNFRRVASEQNSAFGDFVSPKIDTSNNIVSTFASVFFKHESGLHFELGGRYNHHSEYGSNFTYTINPSVVIVDRFKLFAGVASAYKVPTIYQLYSEFGNLELEPEKSTSFEAGFDWEVLPDKVNFSTSFFKRDIQDVIYSYFNPVTFESNYRNGNSQKDKGFEVEMTTHPIKNLTFNAWYAYVTGKSEDANGTETEYLFRRPKNSFGANAGYQVSKAVSFNLIYKYTGQRPEQYYNETTFTTEVMYLKRYSLFDIYLQVKPISRLTLFADVKNVFDEDYIEWRGFNTRDRNFNAGLKYTFH